MRRFSLSLLPFFLFHLSISLSRFSFFVISLFFFFIFYLRFFHHLFINYVATYHVVFLFLLFLLFLLLFRFPLLLFPPLLLFFPLPSLSFLYPRVLPLLFLALFISLSLPFFPLSSSSPYPSSSLPILHLRPPPVLLAFSSSLPGLPANRRGRSTRVVSIEDFLLIINPRKYFAT